MLIKYINSKPGCSISFGLFLLPALVLALSIFNGSVRAETVTSPLSKDFTRLLQSHSLLALGDIHGSQKPVELLISLLNCPDFSIQIDDIVVEFGNARFQALADQYIQPLS